MEHKRPKTVGIKPVTGGATTVNVPQPKKPTGK